MTTSPRCHIATAILPGGDVAEGSPYSMGSIGKAPLSDNAHLGGMLATEVIVEPGSLCRRVDEHRPGHVGGVLTAEVIVEPGSLCRRVDGLATSIARDRRRRYEQCRRNDKSASGQGSTRMRSDQRPRLHRYPPCRALERDITAEAGRVRQWLGRGPGGQGLGRASTPPACAVKYLALLAGGTRGRGHEGSRR